MTTYDGGRTHQGGGSDYRVQSFMQKKEDLWAYFYSLPSGKRLTILLLETRYFFIFWLGYMGCMLLWKHVLLGIPTSRYVPFLTHLFDMQAYAQAAGGPEFGGLTLAQWRLFLWLLFHLSLLGVMLACTWHMLKRKRPNAWVGKTATFLLGFLVKALTGLVP
jgi:hypothetical protein